MVARNVIEGTGFVLFIGVVSFAVLVGGNPYSFVDYPSLLIVFGCSFAMSVLSGSLFVRSIHDDDRLIRWQSISVSIIFATLVGVMIGVIQLLAIIRDPSVVGSSIATVLLSCFTGLILLAIIALPNLDRYTKRCRKFCEIDLTRIFCLGFPMMCIFVVVLVLMILILSIRIQG